MAKRFTDSRKWYDPWYRKLSIEHKLFWAYLTDTCDHAGFWKVDIEMASYLIGSEIKEAQILDFFNDEKERILVIRKDLWHLPTFIDYQYGELKPTNNTHIAIINKLIKAGVRQGLPSPFVGVKDKDKEEVKDKDNKEYPYLVSKDFKKAFDDYKAFRKEIKSKMTKRAEELSLKKLHKEKMDVAIKMLEKSVMNGWKGIFPPKEGEKDGKGTNKYRGEDPSKFDGIETTVM